jgi:quercetin dioxygenase-like cupin family protein
MRKMLLVPAIALLCLFGAVLAQEAPSTHQITPATEMKWGPVPPIFEKGAFVSVVSGDIEKPGPFVVRLKMPKGYKINPHWHPTDENVTVLAGTFKLGMGETFDEASMKELTVGGFALLPAEMRHYAMAETDAMVQVHGNGPFMLTYVHPEDDPRKREPASR